MAKKIDTAAETSTQPAAEEEVDTGTGAEVETVFDGSGGDAADNDAMSTGAAEEEEEEGVAAGSISEEDPDAEEEEVDEDLFKALPVLKAGNYEMTLTKHAPRIANADDRDGYRSGVECTFEPDRAEYPDAPVVRDTAYARFYDDDKPGFRDMNRKTVKTFRGASLFPEDGEVRLVGKPGAAKKVKMDYDEHIGEQFMVKVVEEEYPKGSGEKQNRIVAIKPL